MHGELGEIDDFIDRWHEAPNGLALHEYLGMTRDEYARWLTSPGTLPSILADRTRRRLRA